MPLPVGELRERLVVACRSQARIVKFVAAHEAARRSERTLAEHPRLAVAEMQLALGKACRMAEQSRHGVACPARIFETFAQHHVAAAFAVHPPRLCKAGEDLRETRCAAARAPACSSG